MNEEHKKNVFRYNMSIYYQSTIIYFVVFLLYLLIRGEFVEDSFKLITRDPIIYFFALIVLVSLIALFFNLYKNKLMEIRETELVFIDRFKVRTFKFEDFLEIRITKLRSSGAHRVFRLIRIKLRNRRRPLIIRPYDYENEEELLSMFNELKLKVESR